MSGRLPTLKDSQDAFSAKKKSLKFKPKAVARRSTKERENSAIKIKTESEKQEENKKKFDPKRKPMSNLKKRVPRYLNNTHVITSGPLAAGNFVGDGGMNNNLRRGFIKTDQSETSLVQQGLQSIANDINDSDADSDDEIKSGGNANRTRFNMGREYKLGHDEGMEQEALESEEELDDEALQSRRIEQMFPVRPLRVRHEDINNLMNTVKDTFSEPPTRDPTPGLVQVKLENEESTALETDIKRESQDDVPQSIDLEETINEFKQLQIDYKHIASKIKRINNKPNRFMLLQLPYQLPKFEDITPKKELVDADADLTNNEVSVKKEDKDEKKIALKKPAPKKKLLKQVEPPLIGNIGALRVHKSGKITIRIGNSIMNVSRGAESAFLQDLVALNVAEDEDEASTVEFLGKVDGRMVATPDFE